MIALIHTLKNMSLLPVLLLLTVAPLQRMSAQGEYDDVVKAQLIADTTAVKAGGKISLGVLLDIKPDWHIYWVNPGESGFATDVSWTMPAQVTAGPLKYPAPISFISPGDLMSYGYEGQTMLVTEAVVGTVTGSEVEIVADAKWLMCSDRCVPGKKKLTIKLPVGEGKPANEEIFNHYRKLLPKPGTVSAAKITKAAQGNNIAVTVMLTPGAGSAIVGESKGEDYHAAYFYPYKQEDAIVKTSKAPEPTGTVGGMKVYDKPVSLTYTIEPTGAKKDFPIEGVLVHQTITPDSKTVLEVVEIKQK